MKKSARGFIPLVAIVLLGLVAVTGAAIVAVSIHNKTANEKAVSVSSATSTSEQPSAPTGTTDSAPVSARVQSSGASATKTASDAPSTPVAQISATLDADTKAICDQTGTQEPVTAGQPYTLGIPTWCKELQTPAADTSDQEVRWQTLETKIKSAWKLTQQQQNLDNMLQSVPVVDHSTSGPSVVYDAAQCTAQKKGLVAQADQMYLTWYGQWQDARKTVDACYSSNSVPVCDKQMSEINVAWQNKLTAQFDNLHDQLTSCAPDDRHFSDVSSVVAAPY